MNMNTFLHKVSELRMERDRLVEKIARLTAERDEATEQAERWEDDVLRLMNERNAAQEERDEARRIAIALQVQLQQVSPGPKRENPSDTARRIAEERGWNLNEEAMP